MTAVVTPLRAGPLGGVPHGFLTRAGGVSTGVWRGLNVGLGSHDDPAAIAENRARATAAVAPGATLATLRQVHSAKVVTLAGPLAVPAPEADGLVTDRPGLLLGVLTADCAPVLLADAAAGVVGAAHAGWKGALGGVIEETVAAMTALGARREAVVAAVGPCIARASYEVDESFRDRFLADDPANERFFVDGRVSGRHQFDLEAFVVNRVAQAGITRVTALGLDTYADADRFFSFRRATHAGERDYGRQLSCIALPR